MLVELTERNLDTQIEIVRKKNSASSIERKSAQGAH